MNRNESTMEQKKQGKRRFLAIFAVILCCACLIGACGKEKEETLSASTSLENDANGETADSTSTSSENNADVETTDSTSVSSENNADKETEDSTSTSSENETDEETASDIDFSSDDTIALSEILLSEDDVLYFANWDELPMEELGEETETEPYCMFKAENGELGYEDGSNKSLGEFSQLSDEEIREEIGHTKQITPGHEVKRKAIRVDSEGNTVALQFYIGDWSVDFGAFQGRITVSDSTYMVFLMYSWGTPERFYLIRDTDKTRGKTPYLDQPEVEGFEVIQGE